MQTKARQTIIRAFEENGSEITILKTLILNDRRYMRSRNRQKLKTRKGKAEYCKYFRKLAK